jgi:hypothetical protein
MLGSDLTIHEYQKFCKGVEKLDDLDRNASRSAAGYLIDSDQYANPCGIAAKYIFNDTYLLFDSLKEPVFINSTGISFRIDQQFKYKRHPVF